MTATCPRGAVALLRVTLFLLVALGSLGAICSAAPSPQYYLTDLGVLRNEIPPPSYQGPGTPGTGSVSFGMAVNRVGHVVGSADTEVNSTCQGSNGLVPCPTSVNHAFLYTGEALKEDLGTFPLPSNSPTAWEAVSGAYGLNAADDVVGYGTALEANNSTEQHAALWHAGKLTDLGAIFNELYPGNTQSQQNSAASYAFSVNDYGQVAGVGFDYSTQPGDHAFIYDINTGVMTDISTDFYKDQPYNLQASSASPNYESAAYDINDNGQVAGYVYYESAAGDPNGQFNGRYPAIYDTRTGHTAVLLSSASLDTPLFVSGSTPGWDEDVHINNLGDVAFTGSYPGQAMLWKDGQFIDLNSYVFPDAFSVTPGSTGTTYSGSALGLNDADQVVGAAEFPTDASGKLDPSGSWGFHAVLWQNGYFYDLNQITQMPPGWQLESATAINNSGQIVGTAQPPGGAAHAYLLTPVGSYTITDLGSANVNAINNSGQIAGQTKGQPALWTPDAPNGAVSSGGFVNFLNGAVGSANGINSSGQVAGQFDSGVTDTLGNDETQGFLWTPASPNGSTGQAVDMGILGSEIVDKTPPPAETSNTYQPPIAGSGANAVNDSGNATGWTTTPGSATLSYVYVNVINGPDTINNTFGDVLDAMLYDAGTHTLTGVPTGDRADNVGGGAAINNSGQIAGWGHGTYFDEENYSVLHNEAWANAFFYDPLSPAVTNIPTLDAAAFVPPNPFNEALGINDAGQVVGQSEINYGYQKHAFLWQSDGLLLDLNALPGAYQDNQGITRGNTPLYSDSLANAINAKSQAVGWSTSTYDPSNSTAGNPHAVLWTGDSLTDLNDALPANSGWLLQQAVGINDSGEIIGYGSNPSGNTDSFLLRRTGTGVLPALTSATASPYAVAAGDAVQVSVSVSDPSQVTSVTANGTPLADTGGGTWSGDISASAILGPHTITILASDAAGNTAADSTTSYDTLRVVGISGRDAVQAVAASAANSFLFFAWGRVSVVDENSFTLDDGSGILVKVIAPGYLLKTGDYAAARGSLSVVGGSATLNCLAAHVVKLD